MLTQEQIDLLENFHVILKEDREHTSQGKPNYTRYKFNAEEVYELLNIAGKQQCPHHPMALIGELPEHYPDCFAPRYEDNANGVLHVCICDKCEDPKPRLKILAEKFRLNLLYKNKDNQFESIVNLFT